MGLLPVRGLCFQVLSSFLSQASTSQGLSLPFKKAVALDLGEGANPALLFQHYLPAAKACAPAVMYSHLLGMVNSLQH